MSLNLLPRSLAYVDAVAKNGSIQAASRVLGISASAIDRQILLLEEAAHMRLFDRHSNGMTLTKAGEMLVVLARRWRNDGNALWSEMQQMQGVDLGQVRIAIMDSQVNGMIPDFVGRVAAEFPLVQLDLEVMSPGDAVQALDQGIVDIALAFNAKPHRNIRALWSERLPLGCVVAPNHDLANEESVTLQQITEFPVVLQSQALSIRQYLEADHEWLIHEGRQPVATNSLQLVKRLIAQGRHVALTSELDVSAEIFEKRLVFIPIADETAAAQSISLLVSAVRELPTVSQLIMDILSACARETLSRVRQV
ncbi:LysR family transcriptional regulator [Paracoccus methylarcula]|nr:LysR family transcriptional regulator [Paracoccus methylarcula]